jgi:2-dehydro-3-deoxygalactonokinase
VIAIDWGTSGFRAYRLGSQGDILESRASEMGILSVPPKKFPEVLEEQAGDWIAQGESPIVMSGMVGSRQGWVEAPYVPCPAGFAEIAAAMREVRWEVGRKRRRAWIVPGLSCRDAAGVHDVMRGEEVQLLGVSDELPLAALVCLPGTHSKWVVVANKRIVKFSTYMTGEIYAVLKQHSILGRMMEQGIEGGKADSRAFSEGVNRSGEPGGLLHHLFGVRTRGLMGELGPAASASYLSGILIGHELREAAGGADRVQLLGAAALVGLYQQAAASLGIDVQVLDPDAAVRALFRLGVMLRAQEES